MQLVGALWLKDIALIRLTVFQRCGPVMGAEQL